jgi:hypothetical protein
VWSEVVAAVGLASLTGCAGFLLGRHPRAAAEAPPPFTGHRPDLASEEWW